MKLKTYLIFFSSVLLLISVFGACTNKKQRFLYDKINYDTTHFYQNQYRQDYKLRASDIVYIKILTTDEKINTLFNIGDDAGNNARVQAGGEFYLSGFTVTDSGYIKVPVLGEIFVAGKTLPEVRDLVQNQTDKYLKNAITNVRLVSFRISFLGEVRQQGAIFFYQEKIDVIEALARAGGVTDYADLTKIKVISPRDNGYFERDIDLTKIDLLSKESIMLYPNDIVIVDALKNKTFRNRAQDYFMITSVFTSTISTIFLILSLTK
jgi:polysaccharide export outer membrane protein